MTYENSDTPSIRFAGFTDDWEQRKLGNCAEFNPKSELPETFEYVDLESVVGTDILSHRTESKSSAPSRAQRLAQKGDVFYQTVRPYQKNNCIFEKDDNNWVFSTGYAQLRSFNDGYFLLALLQNDDFVRLVLDRCTGTSYPAINSNDLADIDVSIPIDSEEQYRIGAYFKKLDTLITLHQRKCDALQRFKKSMLQKMFPQDGESVPEIRFAGFTDSWEQRKLGDVIEESYNGQTPSRAKDEYWNGSINWLASGDLNRGIVTHTTEKITDKGLEDTRLRIIPKGTFVMAITGLEAAGTRGNCGILGIDTALNQSCMALFPKDNILDTKFMFQWYCKVGEEYGINYTQGTKQQSYNAELIQILPISFPNIAEQQKIANYFSQLDALITLHQRKLETLQKMKKALLQKMFV